MGNEKVAKQTIVVKLGTSVLTAGQASLNTAQMVELVRQCAQLKQAGHQVVVVTSGAVAAGRAALGKPCGHSLVEKQMLAAIGQGQLIHLWQNLFALYGITVAQMLLTRADVEDRSRYLTARDTLTQLLAFDVVPIINENDAVATAEIKVGDNDNLSAMVAILANADKLLLLTDQAGLFTADPRSNPDAALINEVHCITDELKSLAGGSGTALGTGGMATKLQAADIATRAGVEVLIARGSTPNIIAEALSGKAPSTTFVCFKAPVDGRKRWLLAGPKSSGRITCDEGAVTALCDKGASLLAKGIVALSGEFAVGDLVSLCDVNGREFAKGLCRFNHQELEQLKGVHSREFAALLGYIPSNVVLHRDDMVLLGNEAADKPYKTQKIS
ncbi:glutamate 5-kinase [Pseudoalteromonas fenneropenaei]|uniref:Glutamate 5-kinase n=1 Tax=Pseudoalteromonas fenneropenaei TaxID=1737459 RepID=A0ABV7CH23_9GAMM